MEINWDSIKYIFQIPRDWFRYIHRKIHNAYGVLFIRVMDGEYGGMKIDIDKQVFKETVEDVINLDKYVKSVNDVKPDVKGNVDLGSNFLEESDITTPGIVVGTDYNDEQTVCSPNHKHNIKDVDGSIIKTINGKSPDENGNVVIEESSVQKVNNVEPDENGNVDLGILVKSVNDHEPDENGKITFSVVEKVDGVEPVNGNVPLGAIRSINNTIRPVNGNVDLTNVFAPVEHTHPHTQISDWNKATKDFLKATELTSPGIVVGTDYNGEQTVCSPNHKHNAKDIVNDEESGFVTVNTEQNITASKRFTNGSNLSVANSDSEGVFVKPTGEIAISGNDDVVKFRIDTNTSTNPFTINKIGDCTIFQQQNGALCLLHSVKSSSIVVRQNGAFIIAESDKFQSVGTYAICVCSNGILLSGNYSENATTDDLSGVQLINGGIFIKSKQKCGLLAGEKCVEIQVPQDDSSKYILLTANANNSKLLNQPTDTDENSLAIATCGYVQKNAITIPNGKELKTYNVTFVSDVTWDGTMITVKKRVLEFTKGVLTAVKNAASTTIDTVAYSPS